MKFRLSLILIIISVVLGYSSTTEIKIKNIKNIYDRVLNEVPLLRFINSKEGIGYSYFLKFLDNQITSDATDLNNLFNNSLEIYSNKEYTFNDFLNPNYLQILKKIIDESEYFTTSSKDATTINDVLENVFDYDYENGKYITENNEVQVFNNENGTSFIQDQEIDISEPSTSLIYGKIKNFFQENKSWNYYFTVENRTLNGYFESESNSYLDKNFNIRDLEEEKIFGDVLKINKITKNKFIDYIQEFLIPHDKFSEENFDYVLNGINDEEFIMVDSRNILDDKEYSFLVFSQLNLDKIEDFLDRKNLVQGRLGSFSYFRLSHEKVGNSVYVYYDNNETIFSTLIPENMRVYLGEVKRFKYLRTYQSLEKKENISKIMVIDLERYFSNKFYSTSGSFITVEFFSENNKDFVNVHIK
ncbi:MAG: hypothetical protein ACQESN_02415 [Thermotogota bacterium]